MHHVHAVQKRSNRRTSPAECCLTTPSPQVKRRLQTSTPLLHCEVHTATSLLTFAAFVTVAGAIPAQAAVAALAVAVRVAADSNAVTRHRTVSLSACDSVQQADPILCILLQGECSFPRGQLHEVAASRQLPHASKTG